MYTYIHTYIHLSVHTYIHLSVHTYASAMHHLPMSVKKHSFKMSLGHATQPEKVLSSPRCGALGACLSTSLLLWRSVFSQTPVCLAFSLVGASDEGGFLCRYDPLTQTLFRRLGPSPCTPSAPGGARHSRNGPCLTCLAYQRPPSQGSC